MGPESKILQWYHILLGQDIFYFTHIYPHFRCSIQDRRGCSDPCYSTP